MRLRTHSPCEAVRFAAQRLAGFHEVVDSARPLRQSVRLIWSMQCGIQFTISAFARAFQKRLAIFCKFRVYTASSCRAGGVFVPPKPSGLMRSSPARYRPSMAT